MNRYPRQGSDGNTTAAGLAVERAAEQWLRAQGLQRIASNYRCKCGEIDLVMRHGEQLVFVEVRLRSNRNYGGAAASVTRTKQRRLIGAAQWYLAQHPQWRALPCRFDVLAAAPAGNAYEWEWLRDAFQAF